MRKSLFLYCSIEWPSRSHHIYREEQSLKGHMSRMDRKWRCIGLLMMALTLGLVRGQTSLSSNTVTPQPSTTSLIIDVTSDLMMPLTEIDNITDATPITSQSMQTTTMIPTSTLTPTPTPSVVMPTTTIFSETSSFSVATSPTMVAVTSPTPTVGEV